MLSGRSGLLALALSFVSLSAAWGGALDGIGVIGDSYSDEYEFYPDSRSTARNWVEIVAEARGLNFGAFSTVGRGEPRNQGYAYNWARSAATTDDMIRGGQHIGLAAQVARGEVTLACLFIGGNDFVQALAAPDPASALRTVAPRAVKNVRTAVDAVLAASPEVEVLLWTVPDICDLPEFARSIEAGTLAPAVADACTRAIDEFNAQLRALALRERRVAVMELALAVKVTNRLAPEGMVVAGHRLDRRVPGNGPAHAFLADGRHLGTLGHGMFARLFIVTLNRKFGAGLAPLTDSELLSCAGAAAAGPAAPGPLSERIRHTRRPVRVARPDTK